MAANKVPQIWRLKLNPSGGEVKDPRQIFDYCRDNGIIGLGWGVPELCEATDDFETYWKYAQQAADNGAHPSFRNPASARRLALEMKNGDLCWLRSPDNVYFVVRIEEDWRYRSVPEGRYDLYNHRPAKFLRVGNTSAAPGRVVASFLGSGHTLSR